MGGGTACKSLVSVLVVFAVSLSLSCLASSLLAHNSVIHPYSVRSLLYVQLDRVRSVGRAKHEHVAAYLRSKDAVQGRASTVALAVAEDPAAELCAAAARGDTDALRSLVLAHARLDVNQGDYDQRRALHLAASEGLMPTATCLVDELGAAHSPIDRWGGGWSPTQHAACMLLLRLPTYADACPHLSPLVCQVRRWTMP